MVVSVSGAFYVFETETDPTREDLIDFFKDLTENDILEVRVKKPFGRDIVYHVTRFFLDNDLRFMNLALEKSDQVFQQVSRMNLYDCILPVFENGSCVNFVKNIETNYQHYYRYEGEIDVSFLNRYKTIALTGLNEYSVELYKKALPLWKGEEVFLVGEEWQDYLDVLPTPEGIRVTITGELPQCEDLEGSLEGNEEIPGENEGTSRTGGGRMLQIVEGLPGAERLLGGGGLPGSEGLSEGQGLSEVKGLSESENVSGCEKDIMTYDDIMALTFMFSYVISPGCLNPEKKFFVIDGRFAGEGFFPIWDKVFTAARYALAKGYLPIFQIVSSDGHKYSDALGEDIWNKFFLQPDGYTMKEVHNSSYLALSPNMNLSPEVRHFMEEVFGGTELSWPRGIFNSRVKKYITERGDQILSRPEKALGVLVKGAKEVDVPASGCLHHASVEMVIDKIEEIKETWDFDHIYLFSGDEKAREKMIEQFGTRVITAEVEECSRQAELDTEPESELGSTVETMAEMDKKKDEGFRFGAEYLCSVSLLARCGSLIASGDCGVVREALRENEGRYKRVYVFGMKG